MISALIHSSFDLAEKVGTVLGYPNDLEKDSVLPPVPLRTGLSEVLNLNTLALGYVVAGLAALLLLPTLLFCLRLFLLTIFSVFHLRTAPGKRPESKIGVLVYARDGEFFIEKLVRGMLSGLDYPEDLFEVIVLADNCSDSTAYLAGFAGARVLERLDRISVGRCYALEWALTKLVSENAHDAFLILDADVVLSRLVLRRIDVALSKGALAMRLPLSTPRADESWVTRIEDVADAAQGTLLPRGRDAVGLSAGLPWTGYCLATSLLREIPYMAYSEMEHLDYHVKLVLAGERVRFVRGSNLEWRAPLPSSEITRRRRALDLGCKATAAKYAGELIKSVLKFNLAAKECLSDLIAPSPTLLASALVVVLGAGGLLLFGSVSMPGCDPLGRYALAILAAAAAGLASLAAHATLAVIEARLPFVTWTALFMMPIRLVGRLLGAKRTE